MPAQTSSRPAAAGEALEFARIQGIQAEVHPLQARLRQGPRQTVEDHPIGGHRKGAHARGVGDVVHQVDDIRTHGRLAAGQAEFIETQSGEQMDQAQDFVVLHQLGIGPEADVIRHAVQTSQVAVIRQADA